MQKLERTLGLRYVVAISIGAMLGSGVFVLPGLAAAKTGPSVWLAYLFAGLCVLPAALSKAEMATAMPTSGGTYVYVDRAFGPLAGTVCGLGLWLSLLLKSSFALLGFGAYLQVLGLESSEHLKPLALGLLILIVGLNLVGIRKVGKVMLAVVVLALVGLMLLVVISAVRPHMTPPERLFSSGSLGFLETAAFVFVSYAGVTKVAAIAEEVKDPGRNLPRGILYSLAAVALLYAAVVLMLVDHVPIAALDGDVRPVYTLAVQVAGPVVGSVFAVLGVVTMASMANAGLLASSRFPFAMSRDHLLPPILRTVHVRFRTPTAAVLATAVPMALAIAFLDVEKMAKLASAFVILIFIIECLAVVLLRESQSAWYRPSYRSPLYPAVQIFGIVSGVTLLAALGITSILAIAAVVVPGVLVYYLYGCRRTDRTGVMERYGRATDTQETPPEISGLAAGISRDAAVVVALFGWERSPEVLVESGIALARGRPIAVVHLTEMPQEIPVDIVMREDPGLRSVRRRVLAMASEQGADVRFEAVVCRNLALTIQEVSTRLHCEWLVTAWRGRQSRSRFMFLNQLGWRIHHLDSNLAQFRDAGIRHISRILVYPEPGPDDGLVVRIADELAGLERAELTFVAVVPARADEHAEAGGRDYLDSLRAGCRAPTHVLVLRSDDGVEALVETTASYDLLVTGASPPRSWLERLRGSDKDRLKESAACSVLSLKTPQGRTHDVATPARKRLLDLIAPSCVTPALDVGDKRALFARLAAVFAHELGGVEPSAIEEALWDREHAQNTSVGGGAAIPHATLDGAARTVVGLATLQRPLDYGSADGLPVETVFASVGPPADRQLHLEVLAGVSRLLLRSGLRERLAGVTEREGAMAALREASAEADGGAAT